MPAQGTRKRSQLVIIIRYTYLPVRKKKRNANRIIFNDCNLHYIFSRSKSATEVRTSSKEGQQGKSLRDQDDDPRPCLGIMPAQATRKQSQHVICIIIPLNTHILLLERMYALCAPRKKKDLQIELLHSGCNLHYFLAEGICYGGASVRKSDSYMLALLSRLEVTSFQVPEQALCLSRRVS